MDGKRGPGPREPAEAEAGELPATRETPERLGPLELLRLRKDDGRHLIVYARIEAEPEPER